MSITTSAPTGPGRSVVFIDGALADWEILAAGVPEDADIVRLDTTRDGLSQMAAWSEGREGYDAVHVLSHGEPGRLVLGSGTLDTQTLEARADELATLGSALTPEGDLLLYGCNVAQGEMGRTFVESLSAAIGADVAASDDLTGAADQGGDWELEVASGLVDSVFGAEELGNFDGTLATYTVTNNLDSGAGSLRQAIADANSSAGADTIEFSENFTIELQSNLGIYDVLTINGDRDGDGSPDIILDNTDSTSSGGIFIGLSSGSPVINLNGLHYRNLTDDSNGAAVNLGGAVDTQVNIDASVFEGISSTYVPSGTSSGAVIYGMNGGSDINISRSIFYGAGQDGGAVSGMSSNINYNISNSLFFENDGVSSIVQANGSTAVATLRNVTIADNIGAADFLASGGASFVAYNSILSNIPASGSNNVARSDITFTNAADDDYSLADGETDAIDQGTNAQVAGTLDLAGNTRIVNSIVDIGGYEVPANNAPVFTASTTTATFAEDATGTIFDFNAHDGDGGANDAVSYSLSGTDAARFNISTAGELTFKAAPNYESPTDAGGNNVYDITVTADDNGSSHNTTSVDLAVTVSDVAGTVTLAAAPAAISENGGSSTLTATISDPWSGGDITVNLGYGGDATAGADHDQPGSITISSGQTTGQVTLNAVDDSADETDETVNVSINSVSGGGASENGTQAAAVTITDDDTAGIVVSESGGTTTAAEGATDSFDVVLNSLPTGDVVIDIASDDTTEATISDAQLTFTTANWNTPQTVTVTAPSDSTVDGTKTPQITLSVNDTATADAAYDAVADATVNTSITDDDTATLAISDIAVNENDGTATVTVTLTGAVEGGVTVDAGTSNGTASAGADYTPVTGRMLSFIGTDGETESFDITLVDDALHEASETINVALSDLTAAAGVSIADGDAVVTVNDNDAAPTVTLSASPLSVSEEGGVSTVTATLSAASAQDTTVTLGASGTATGGGTDYTLSSNSIVIAAGATTGTATVTGSSDLVSEGPETVILDVDSVTNGTEDGTQQVTVTLSDDDAAPAPVSIVRAGGASEITNADSVDFTVTFSEAVDATTVAAADFAASNGTIDSVSPATGSSDTFTVTVGGIASLNDTVALGLDAGADIRDAGGNGLSTTTPSGTVEQYTIDNTPPAAPTIATGIAGDDRVNAAEDGSVVISGTADPNATVQVSIDDTAGSGPVTAQVMADGTGNWTLAAGNEVDLSTLNDDTLTVSVTQVDAVGNTSIAAATTIAKDTAISTPAIAPGIAGDAIVTAAEAGAVDITVNTVETGASVTLTVDDGDGGTTNLTPTQTATATSVVFAGLDLTGLSDGTLSIAATQTDAAGNTSSASTTASVVLDTAPAGVLTTASPGFDTAAEDTVSGGNGYADTPGNGIVNDRVAQAGVDNTIRIGSNSHINDSNTVIDGVGDATSGAGGDTNTVELYEDGTAQADFSQVDRVDNVDTLDVKGAGTFDITMSFDNGWGDFSTIKGNGSTSLTVVGTAVATTGKTFTDVDTLRVASDNAVLTIDADHVAAFMTVEATGSGNETLSTASQSLDLSTLTTLSGFEAIETTFAGEATFIVGAETDLAAVALRAQAGHVNTLQTTETTLSVRGGSVDLTNIARFTTTNTTGTHFEGGNIAETFIGGSGDDLIEGYDGADSIVGGAGADTLTSGDGADTLTGGDGNDVFLHPYGGDTITDFQEGDIIRIQSVTGATADHWDWDAGTGTLRFDRDKNDDFTDTHDIVVTLNNIGDGTFSVADNGGDTDITYTAPTPPSTGGGGGGGTGGGGTGGGGTGGGTGGGSGSGGGSTGGGGSDAGGDSGSTGGGSPTTSTEDGATVTRTRTTTSNGREQEVTEIRPTSQTREEDPDSPNGSLADVTLASDGDDGNEPALRAGLPAGVGLRAEGSPNRLSREDALADLIDRIEQKTQDGSEPREEMTGIGQSFLNTIPEDSQLYVKTVTPTLGDGAQSASGPITITGAPDTPGRQEALVIDVSNLPRGTILQLDDVDFAAIVGDVRVIGGSGSNVVTGDDSAQIIVLGADDDILHGGGGDDEIGSEGGDDQLFGERGNDTVFGGEGDDSVSGGRGDDVLRGDEGTDTVIYSGAVEDFRFTVKDGLVHAIDTVGEEGTDSLQTIELGSFDGEIVNLSFAAADTALVTGVASIYHGVLDRAADIAGLNYWVEAAAHAGVRAVANAFTAEEEFAITFGANLSDDQFVENIYQHVLGRGSDAEGKAWWVNRLGEGADRGEMIVGFSTSDEHIAMISTDDGVWLV